MSIFVEHAKRRNDILEKALDVFVEVGFENATFQKIADRSGITRTTLYIYFRNKREIFNYSIKHYLRGVENDIYRIRKNENLDTVDKLIEVVSVIIDSLEKNRRLLSVILNYLLHISKSSIDPDIRVRKRTIKMRHILATMMVEGIRAGEIIPLNVKIMDDLLYGLMESGIFRTVVFSRRSAGELKEAAALLLNQFRAPKKD